jgi:hypothetical protein
MVSSKSRSRGRLFLKSRRRSTVGAIRRIHLCLEELEIRSLPSATPASALTVLTPQTSLVASATASAVSAVTQFATPGLGGILPGATGEQLTAYVFSIFETLSKETGSALLTGGPGLALRTGPELSRSGLSGPGGPSDGTMSSVRGGFPLIFAPGAGVALLKSTPAATDSADLSGGGPSTIDDSATADDSQTGDSQVHLESVPGAFVSLDQSHHPIVI